MSFVQQTKILMMILQNGSNAGDMILIQITIRLQGVEISDDGTKLFILFMEMDDENTRLLEYNFQLHMI